MPDVWILGECSAASEARLQSFVEEALAELGADLDVPVHLAAPYPGKPNTGGWASSRLGVHIVADRLECTDSQLRRLVFHEVAHGFAFQEYPALQPPFAHELFASWFAGRSAPPSWSPAVPDDNYGRGVLVGAALAGDETAREVAACKGHLPLIACLEDIDEPRAFAEALLDHPGVPGSRGLQRRGCPRCRGAVACPGRVARCGFARAAVRLTAAAENQ